MPQKLRSLFKSLLFACALTGCLLPAPAALGRQEPTRPETTTPPQDAAAQDDEEPIRIDTELIQTGVMVFDKQGRFVDGLKQDDFELTVEGRPAPLSFFERVVTAAPPASSSPQSTSSPQAAARGGAKGPVASAERAEATSPRTIIFFVDDRHLSFESRKRARDLINHFLDTELTDEDTAAVVSSSGRLGFLQQFTDNPAVLRAAAARLGDDKNREEGDRLIPPMSETEALLIDHRDPQVTNEFAALIIAEGLALTMEDAVLQAYSRARNVLQTASILARNTYLTLEQTLRRSAQMPGRKIVMLISDGFLLDSSNTDSTERMRRVTDAAARANAVVYTFDAKGLDATSPKKSWTAAGFRVKSDERFYMQEPLAAIAEQTGGRLFKNRNDMRPNISQAVAEASRYYLLAWRPDPELRGKDKFRRITVKVKGRPELAVRLQNGYMQEEPKELAKAAKGGAKNVKAGASATPPLSPEQEQLRAALNSFAPQAGLPTSLSLNYLEAEGGSVLAALVRVEGSAVSFTREAGQVKAEVDVVGVVYDSKGKTEDTFSRRLSLNAPQSRFEGGRTPNVYYNYQTKLAPGLHQMRVATRDVKTGQTGSAVQWVEVPDLSKRKLALSSLLVAEARSDAARRLTAPAAEPKAEALPEPVAADISVDRRFERTSALRYVVFIYNAARPGAVPDVTLQTQLFRGKRALVAAPPARVKPDGQDAARLAYAAEVPLEGLPPGRYSLRVTVSDRASKSTATQRLSFVVK
jgi:VWFA-related protein